MADSERTHERPDRGRASPRPGVEEGPLPGANAIGESGSLDSGPGVRLSLRVDLDRRILSAGFEVRGIDAARPVLADLCRGLLGATVDDAERTTLRAVARLGALDEGDPAARQIHFALRGALRAWTAPAAERGSEVICACFALERTQIVTAIQEHGLRTIDDVREHMPATRGCGTCRPDIARLLKLATEESD